MNKISESTTISLSLFISCIGAAGFVTYVAHMVQTNAYALEKIEHRQDAIEKMGTDIEVIKVKLENIEKSLHNKK